MNDTTTAKRLDAWTLDPGVRFLNHGSFGATPRAVLDAQQELRARMERNPVAFLARELEGLLDEARTVLAAFVGSQPEDLVFVPNATTGVNAVVRSLELRQGDELVVTDQGYNACSNAVAFAAERAGARVVVAKLPFPIASPREALESILAVVNEHTRLVIADHVASPTGLVMPIEELVASLRERGIETLVDGAHAPGMLPLDLDSFDPAYYTGNCHKWICAPKGAAFLRVRRELQNSVRPAVISHGANAPLDHRPRYRQEFDWVGTADPTAALSIPAALEVMGSMFQRGWSGLRHHNRELALGARATLCEVLGIEAPAPDSMIGSLVSLPLPDGSGGGSGSAWDVDPLQSALLEKHGIEVPVVPWPASPRRLLRVSAQAYNTPEDFRALGDALRTELS